MSGFTPPARLIAEIAVLQSEMAAARLKPPPRDPLAAALEHAVVTQQLARDHLFAMTVNASDAVQAAQDRLEDDAYEAKQALLDHLLDHHGIGSHLAAKFGEVLP